MIPEVIEERNFKGKLEVVLDLDNTLIHSVTTCPLTSEANYFRIRDGIFVYKRPHLEFFLSELVKIAEVSLFTASKKDYADQILAIIDP